MGDPGGIVCLYRFCYDVSSVPSLALSVISVLKQDLFKRMFGKVIGSVFILGGVALLKLKRI